MYFRILKYTDLTFYNMSDENNNYSSLHIRSTVELYDHNKFLSDINFTQIIIMYHEKDESTKPVIRFK